MMEIASTPAYTKVRPGNNSGMDYTGDARTAMFSFTGNLRLNCAAFFIFFIAGTFLFPQTAGGQSLASIHVDASAPAAAFYVDGQMYTAPVTFMWPAGSKHTLSVDLTTPNGVTGA